MNIYNDRLLSAQIIDIYISVFDVIYSPLKTMTDKNELLSLSGSHLSVVDGTSRYLRKAINLNFSF